MLIMAEEVEDNIIEVCRLCLNKGGLVSIFDDRFKFGDDRLEHDDNRLISAIRFLTRQQISENDDISTKICMKCSVFILKTHSAIQKFNKNHDKLKQRRMMHNPSRSIRDIYKKYPAISLPTSILWKNVSPVVEADNTLVEKWRRKRKKSSEPKTSAKRTRIDEKPKIVFQSKVIVEKNEVDSPRVFVSIDLSKLNTSSLAKKVESSDYNDDQSRSMFVCGVCSAIFNSVKDLGEHKKIHMQCNFCNSTFHTMEEAKNHQCKTSMKRKVELLLETCDNEEELLRRYCTELNPDEPESPVKRTPDEETTRVEDQVVHDVNRNIPTMASEEVSIDEDKIKLGNACESAKLPDPTDTLSDYYETISDDELEIISVSSDDECDKSAVKKTDEDPNRIISDAGNVSELSSDDDESTSLEQIPNTPKAEEARRNEASGTTFSTSGATTSSVGTTSSSARFNSHHRLEVPKELTGVGKSETHKLKVLSNTLIVPKNSEDVRKNSLFSLFSDDEPEESTLEKTRKESVEELPNRMNSFDGNVSELNSNDEEVDASTLKLCQTSEAEVQEEETSSVGDETENITTDCTVRATSISGTTSSTSSTTCTSTKLPEPTETEESSAMDEDDFLDEITDICNKPEGTITLYGMDASSATCIFTTESAKVGDTTVAKVKCVDVKCTTTSSSDSTRNEKATSTCGTTCSSTNLPDLTGTETYQMPIEEAQKEKISDISNESKSIISLCGFDAPSASCVFCVEPVEAEEAIVKNEAKIKRTTSSLPDSTRTEEAISTRGTTCTSTKPLPDLITTEKWSMIIGEANSKIDKSEDTVALRGLDTSTKSTFTMESVGEESTVAKCITTCTSTSSDKLKVESKTNSTQTEEEISTLSTIITCIKRPLPTGTERKADLMSEIEFNTSSTSDDSEKLTIVLSSDDENEDDTVETARNRSIGVLQSTRVEARINIVDDKVSDLNLNDEDALFEELLKTNAVEDGTSSRTNETEDASTLTVKPSHSDIRSMSRLEDDTFMFFTLKNFCHFVESDVPIRISYADKISLKFSKYDGEDIFCEEKCEKSHFKQCEFETKDFLKVPDDAIKQSRSPNLKVLSNNLIVPEKAVMPEGVVNSSSASPLFSIRTLDNLIDGSRNCTSRTIRTTGTYSPDQIKPTSDHVFAKPKEQTRFRHDRKKISAQSVIESMALPETRLPLIGSSLRSEPKADHRVQQSFDDRKYSSASHAQQQTLVDSRASNGSINSSAAKTHSTGEKMSFNSSSLETIVQSLREVRKKNQNIEPSVQVSTTSSMPSVQAPAAHQVPLVQAPAAHQVSLVQAPAAHQVPVVQAPAAHQVALVQAYNTLQMPYFHNQVERNNLSANPVTHPANTALPPRGQGITPSRANPLLREYLNSNVQTNTPSGTRQPLQGYPQNSTHHNAQIRTTQPLQEHPQANVQSNTPSARQPLAEYPQKPQRFPPQQPLNYNPIAYSNALNNILGSSSYVPTQHLLPPSNLNRMNPQSAAQSFLLNQSVYPSQIRPTFSVAPNVRYYDMRPVQENQIPTRNRNQRAQFQQPYPINNHNPSLIPASIEDYSNTPIALTSESQSNFHNEYPVLVAQMNHGIQIPNKFSPMIRVKNFNELC